MIRRAALPDIVRRKKNIIVYLKEGDRIVDVLNVMDAPLVLMELENVRILKDSCDLASHSELDEIRI